MHENDREKGTLVLEAAIIFPIVLMAVMALLYLGLFKLQETAMLYQVQRAASQGSLIAASPGYAELAGNGSELDARDIDWELLPSDIDGYYDAYHKNFAVLYREIFGSTWVSSSDLEQYGSRVLDTISLLALGNYFDKTVRMDRSFWGITVVAEIGFQVRTPAALRYFGFPESIGWKQAAYSKAINPAGFMRNTDLATDAIVLGCEKLGLKDKLDQLISIMNEVTTILF